MALIDDPEAARRLSRAIVSDVALYNQAKVQEGIQKDNLFEILEEELDEGRKLYNSRVSPDILEKHNFYDLAIVDVLIKQSGRIESDIWK
ncbi:MAG: hypothetical protein OEV42_02455 [Deltaproteobacteria bacterium]|nr:hypothetical protein [Deltaproteobacteria bacterium]